LFSSKKLKNNALVFLPIITIFLLGIYLFQYYSINFDESVFQAQNVYKHIKELSSPKYNGRQAGTEGNVLALKYIENYFKEIGIEPGGEEGTYYQKFNTLIPDIDNNPDFIIKDDAGEILDKFTIYEDFRLYTLNYGGGIDFEGEILFADSYLYKVDPRLFKDRVVVIAANGLLDKDERYVIENGAKGLLYYQKPVWGARNNSNAHRMKSTSRYNKVGKTMLFGNISKETYQKLKSYAIENKFEDINAIMELGSVIGKIKNVKIKAEVNFPIVETANIIGKIEGSDEDAGYLIISGHMDHVGQGANGKYFPGALDNASGTAMMMELARVIKSQRNSPEKTVLFIGWNAEENGIQGSNYYVENPIYPLDRTEVINIDCIGGIDVDEIVFESSGDYGNILKNKMYQYAEDLDIKARESYGEYGSDHGPFLSKNVPAVMVYDNYENIHMYEDDIKNISIENLENVGRVLLNFIKHDTFKDTFPRYLNKWEISFLTLLLIGLLVIYIVYVLNKFNPNFKFLNLTIEDIYYSLPFNLISKLFYIMIPIIIIVFSFLFIVNLPTNINFIFNQNGYTNFSLYLTIKKSFLYIRQLLTQGMGTTQRSYDVFEIIRNTFSKSGILILFTLIFSFIAGISKGCFDGYKDKGKGQLRTISTLVALSLPDVLIALIGLLGVVILAKNNIIKSMVTPTQLRELVMPVITLTVLPSVYISRITYITVQEELKQGYITTARAKGLSRFRLFKNHLLKSIVIKVVDSLSSVLTIIISNLIIVEFLFGYPGIIYNLLQYYKQDDTITFIGLALSLGVMYVTFNIVFKIVSRLINPLKREGAN